MLNQAAGRPPLTLLRPDAAGAPSESDEMWRRRAKEHLAGAEAQLAQAETLLAHEQVRVERAAIWLAQARAGLAEAEDRVAECRAMAEVWRQELAVMEVAGTSRKVRAAAGGNR